MNGCYFEATGVNRESTRIGRNARITFEQAGISHFRLENAEGEEIPASAGARKYFICIKDTLVLFQSTLSYVARTTDNAMMIVHATDDLPDSSVQHMINLRFSDEEKDVAVASGRVFLIGDGVRVGYNVFMMHFVPVVPNSIFQRAYDGGGDTNRIQVEVDGERLKMLFDTMKIVMDTTGEGKADAVVNLSAESDGRIVISDTDGAFAVRMGSAEGVTPFSIPIRRGDITAFLYGNDSSAKKATLKISVEKREANKPRIISAYVADGRTGEDARYFITEAVHLGGAKRI